jgi:hypothetical protein
VVDDDPRPEHLPMVGSVLGFPAGKGCWALECAATVYLCAVVADP